jgi:hypothetical protein
MRGAESSGLGTVDQCIGQLWSVSNFSQWVLGISVKGDIQSE